jgi:predicted DNA-binding protein (UPF0251 family)
MPAFMTGTSKNPSVRWLKPSGEPVACVEKIKVLNENHEELRQMVRDALEDALLMGCSERHVREVMHALIDEVIPAYGEREDP